MRKLNEEKFFADYDALVAEKETKLATKDQVIADEKAKAENVVAMNGYSDAVKEVLIAGIIAEKEKEFDICELDEKLAKFEQYIDVVEEQVIEEHPEDCECEACVAKRAELVTEENIVTE